MTEIKAKFGDKRRTEIQADEARLFSDADLIPHQRVVVTLSNRGYIKRVPVDTYRKQRRGGRGVVSRLQEPPDASRGLRSRIRSAP